MTKKSLPIRRREAALKVLRTARDLAERGWIKKGRESVHDMLLDCVLEGYREHGDPKWRNRHPNDIEFVTPPDFAMCLSYVCRTIYRNNDPGTNRLRYKMIVKYGGGHSLMQYQRLADAVRLCMKDLQELRAKEKAKR